MKLTRLGPLVPALALTLLTSPASLGDQGRGSSGSGSSGSGSRRPDADIAREAVRRGEFLSLERILAIIARDHPGQILEIELEREDGFWEYEVDIVTPEGRVIEITLDPASGRIVDYGDDDD